MSRFQDYLAKGIKMILPRDSRGLFGHKRPSKYNVTVIQ